MLYSPLARIIANPIYRRAATHCTASAVRLLGRDIWPTRACTSHQAELHHASTVHAPLFHTGEQCVQPDWLYLSSVLISQFPPFSLDRPAVCIRAKPANRAVTCVCACLPWPRAAAASYQQRVRSFSLRPGFSVTVRRVAWRLRTST